MIVDTYGTPGYKEVNPAIFTIITFPFLFGVMFGDIGHGGMMFLLSGLLCLFAEPIKRNAPGLELLVRIRYLLLLMGLFAFFNGWIYNDFVSIPIVGFGGSCYSHANYTEPGGHPGVWGIQQPGCVYPMGVDPAWSTAKNKL